MSTTMVVTMASPPPTTTAPTKLSTTTTTTTTSLQCCPNCGDSLPSPEETQAELGKAQTRIAELEAQVRTLNEKAAAAAERWAGYEEELTRLRSQDQTPPPPPPKNYNMIPPGGKNLRGPDGLAPHHPTRSFTSPNLHAGDQPPQLQRMNSVPVSQAQDTAPPDKTTRDLLQALSREKHLRKEAEGRLTATSKEIEDLSVSLFEQANNMVADERRARAQLEERVGELEKRDLEKRRRLERLETALTRIKHVRSLLDE